MSLKIRGTIKDKATREGVAGLRVEAWDADVGPDQLIGFVLTKASGNYEISGQADDFGLGAARHPDIYITIHVQNEAGQWVPLEESPKHPNHDPTEELQIDLGVEIQDELPLKMTDFRPDVHGFHFRNAFELAVLGHDLTSGPMGFCGGMCAAALHRFRKGEDIPDDQAPPDQGTALYDELLRRQISTLGGPKIPAFLANLVKWQILPELRVGPVDGIGLSTRREWEEKLRSRLDNNNPTILVLIRAEADKNPTDNHQVLAIGYKYHPTTKDLKIYVYDPNWPETTCTLSMNVGLSRGELHAVQLSEGGVREALRGFFVNQHGDAASA